MRSTVIGLFVLALVAAGGVAYLVKGFLTAQTQVIQDEAEEAVATVKVLVAGSDLPAGTTVVRQNLRWVEWPEEAVEKDYVAASEENQDIEKQFVGSVVRRGIGQGIPITAKMFFKRDDPGFLAGALQPGMRAMPISVNAISGAAGFILPGDHVDVILSMKLKKILPAGVAEEGQLIGGVAMKYISETILRDIRVIAVDQQVNDFEMSTVLAMTITLEVTSKQAEALTVAMSMGSLSLSLRSLATDTAMDQGESFTSDMQVSPFLTSVNTGRDVARMAEEAVAAAAKQSTAENAAAKEAAAKEAAEREAAASQETAAALAAAGQEAPVKTDTGQWKVNVYRGFGEPQEITGK